MKLTKTKGMCLILALLMIFGISGTAMAALSRQTLELEVNSGVTVYLNEQEVVSGNNGELEAFVYEGTTYLPIRTISELIGMDIDWDSDTGSVYLAGGNNDAQNTAQSQANEPAPVAAPAVTESTFNFESRTVTLNNGIEMPILGLGTYRLTDEETEASVYSVLTSGYRLIDTAAAYGNKEAVGRGIVRSGVPREEIFITTKLWPNDYANAAEAIDTALERLGVEYIDLLLLHQPWQDYIAAYQAMEDAVAEGKVRAIGLSNFYQNTFTSIMEMATIPPAVLQNERNPYFQQAEMIEFIKPYGTIMMDWFPLGGRGNNEQLTEVQQSLFENEVLLEIGAAHNKTAAQVILRWHLQSNGIAIPGSRNPEHILENITIFDFELTDAEMQRIAALETGIPSFDFRETTEQPDFESFTPPTDSNE